MMPACPTLKAIINAEDVKTVAADVFVKLCIGLDGLTVSLL
jgi:hypothetical protein